MVEDKGEGEEESMTHPLLFSLCIPDLLERDKRRDLFGDGLENVCADQRGRVMLLSRRIHLREQLKKKRFFGEILSRRNERVVPWVSVSTTEDFQQQSLCLGVAP